MSSRIKNADKKLRDKLNPVLKEDGMQTNPDYPLGVVAVISALGDLSLKEQLQFLDLVGGSIYELSEALDNMALDPVVPIDTLPRVVITVRPEQHDGRKTIQLIKLVRQLTGWGLKETKDFVDRITYGGESEITLSYDMIDDFHNNVYNEETWKEIVERSRPDMNIYGFSILVC